LEKLADLWGLGKIWGEDFDFPSPGIFWAYGFFMFLVCPCCEFDVVAEAGFDGLAVVGGFDAAI